MRLLLWECERVICFPFFEGAYIDIADVITLDDRLRSTHVMVVNKPASMSQKDAEKLVTSDEFFTTKGPWEFQGSVK